MPRRHRLHHLLDEALLMFWIGRGLVIAIFVAILIVLFMEAK